MRNTMIWALVGIGLLWLMLPNHAAQAAQRCFVETGYCIDGRIREYWEQNGGLPVFGLPIGPQEPVIVDGSAFIGQRFERNRLELHPENARPYDVLLGRLGADRLAQLRIDWTSFPSQATATDCISFAQTKQSVCGQFLAAYRRNGLQMDTDPAVSEAESLALFGLPLSNVYLETLSDGQRYQVQWFERARFEYHPENPAPYTVLFGLLGNETWQFSNVPTATPVPTAQATPTITMTPTATPMPTLPSSVTDSFRNRMPTGGKWYGDVSRGVLAVYDFTYTESSVWSKTVSFKVMEYNPEANGESQISAVSIIDLDGNYGTYYSGSPCTSGCSFITTNYSYLIPRTSAPAQVTVYVAGKPVVIELRQWPKP